MGTETIKYMAFFHRHNSGEEFVAFLPIASISTESGLRTTEGECRVYELTDWITQNNFERISQLNGYVARDDAAEMSWSKSECLRELSTKDLEALPLVKNGQLIGIVDRTRLLTSILLDITTSTED